MSEHRAARAVTVIPCIPQIQHEDDRPMVRKKKRVAGYARVSTKEDEQQNSYEAQVSYFTEYIKAREEWEFAGVYTDKGISGTSLKRRDGFNAMVRDALEGKIDLIVLKSISRYARNTVDALSTIRLLKAHGVGIYFEKENINSLDDNSEMIITFMSSLAQEESHSISKNVTWGLRNSFANGKVWMPYGQFLGYEKGEDDLPRIVESEAQIVRQIYAMFIAGKTFTGIAVELQAMGIRSPSGKAKWGSSTVRSILTNEKYKGAALLQKSYTLDFLTKEKKKNSGEVQQYYIEHSHPAIIPPEVFDLVQLEVEKRKDDSRRRSSVSCFSNKLVCAECGSFFGRRVWHSTSEYRRIIWQCGHKFKNSEKCRTPHLYEDEIKEAFIAVINRMLGKRDRVVEILDAAVSRLEDMTALEKQIEVAERDVNAISFEMRKEIEANARQVQNQTEYSERYRELAAKWSAANEKLAKLTDAQTERKGRILQIRDCLRLYQECGELLREFDEKLWVGLIEEVKVHPDGKLEFVFKDKSRHWYC